jgi:hypothetical protein
MPLYPGAPLQARSIALVFFCFFSGSAAQAAQSFSTGMPLQKRAAPGADRAIELLDLRTFEIRFEAADQDGLITHDRSLALHAQLDELKAKYNLFDAPDGAGLTHPELNAFKADLDAFSRLLFRR